MEPDEIRKADQVTIAAIATGKDVDAHWRQLWSRHGSTSLRIAQRILRNEDDARSAVNEAWLKAYEGLSPAVACFGSWIATITRNQALDFLRKRQRREAREEPLQPWAHSALLGSATPERQAAGKEALRLVLRCGELTEDERRVLLLRYVGGMANQTIARVTGRPTGTIGVILYRAKRKLRLHPIIQELLIPMALILGLLHSAGGLA